MEILKTLLEQIWFQVVLAIGGLWVTIKLIWDIGVWLRRRTSELWQKTEPRRAGAKIARLTGQLIATERYLDSPSVFIAEITISLIWIATLLAVGLANYEWAQTISPFKVISIPEGLWFEGAVPVRGIVQVLGFGISFTLGFRLSGLFQTLYDVRRFPQSARKSLKEIAESAGSLQCPGDLGNARDAAARFLRDYSDERLLTDKRATAHLFLLYQISQSDLGDAKFWADRASDLSISAASIPVARS